MQRVKDLTIEELRKIIHDEVIYAIREFNSFDNITLPIKYEPTFEKNWLQEVKCEMEGPNYRDYIIGDKIEKKNEG